MRVLVTGGAGFIGSNVVDALLLTGHEVCVVDDLSTGSASNLDPRVELVRLDVLDPDLADVLRRRRPDAVVHLAAQVDVQRSIADPERDRAVNVGGTRAVASAAAASGAKRMLSASSAAVYGEPSHVPVPETARKAPQNPYGASKLAAEAALAEALAGTGTDYASLRFANVYGPRQGWSGEGGVVAIFAHRLLAGETPVIYGDGLQTRDFIFVGDVAAAIIAALGSPDALAGTMPDGPAYNVSTGLETSILDLDQALRALTGRPGASERAPAREGDLQRSALAPGKANGALRWVASTSLEAGLARTVPWFATSA